MASRNYWDQFESVEEITPTGEEEVSINEEFSPLPTEDNLAAPPEKEDYWSQFESVASPREDISETVIESGKGLGRLGGRALASGLAAPSKGIGGILELLASIYPEDNGLRGLPQRALSNAGRFLRESGEEGQKYLKDLIEKGLGESFSSGEEALTGFAERAADIYGRGPFKGFGIPSIIGGAAGQTAKELGAPEEVQAGIEALGVGAKDIAKAIPSLLPKKVVEKSGLVLPRIADKTKQGLKFVKGKVFLSSKEKAYKQVSEQAENLLKEIKSSKFPLSTEIEKGIDVEARINKDLSKVENLASKMDYQIESNFISDYLNKVEEEIGKVPVPSKEEEEILNLVSKYKKQYGTEGGSRFYSPEKYVRQFRKINEDAKSLYERAFIEGKKGKTRQFYRGLNKEIEKTLENGTPQEFSNLFKETNSKFAELQRLESFENILQDITKDGIVDATKFKNIFTSRSKSKALRKQLGNEAYEKTRLIANDLYKVKDKLGLINEMNLQSLVKSGSLSVLLSKLGLLKTAVPLQAAKNIGELLYGSYLLKPKGSREFGNFLKALQSGSKKSIETYLRRLDNYASQEDEKIKSNQSK